MSYSEAIRRLRLARGWKQEELARRTGVQQTYISKIENGQKDNPTQETLVKLAAAFGITVPDLLKEAGIVGVVADQLGELGVPPADLAELTAIWGGLPAEDREMALTLMRSMYERRNRRVQERPEQQQPQTKPATS